MELTELNTERDHSPVFNMLSGKVLFDHSGFHLHTQSSSLQASLTDWLRTETRSLCWSNGTSDVMLSVFVLDWPDLG